MGVPARAERLAGHAPPVALQPLIDAAPPGGVVALNGDAVYYGAVINKPGLILLLNGAVIVPSPGTTITAADITLDCTDGGTFDGDPSQSGQPSPLAGITVMEAGDNLTMTACDVRHWADGVVVQGNVISFKLVNNYLHDNADAGLQIDAGVTLAGVVTITGNLFKVNAGPGIRHNGNGLLPARHNSWGDVNGAAAGDEIGGSGATDASAATFAEAFVGVNPDDFTVTQRTLPPGTHFEAVVAIDAANLFGLGFSLTYDPAILELESVTPGDFVGQGGCLMTPAQVGRVNGFCYRQNPDMALSGEGEVALRMAFLTGNPGISYFDLRTTPGELVAGTRSGVGVYLNNGGYGEVAGNSLREITDENDGEIIVAAPTSVSLVQFGGRHQRPIIRLLGLAGALLLLLILRTRISPGARTKSGPSTKS